MQNPDGRARFIFQNLQGRAAAPDPTPYNAEHDEPWPGGRSNHYLFDMNRDWFAQTQPETRGRITHRAASTGRMSPSICTSRAATTRITSRRRPIRSTRTSPRARSPAFELFGRANAARFDERGWPYFIREVYDSFYPGYGESWPIFHGSIGMTYEQASARSLSFARNDDTVLTYRDGVMHHANAAIVTAITAAKNRERLVRDFLDYRRTPIAEGEKGADPRVRAVARPRSDARRQAGAQPRHAGHRGAARRGSVQGRTRETSPRAPTSCRNAQPTGRLIRNLLDPKTEQPQDFIKRQEERRAAAPAGSDLRHHRLEPAAALRRRAA